VLSRIQNIGVGPAKSTDVVDETAAGPFTILLGNNDNIVGKLEVRVVYVELVLVVARYEVSYVYCPAKKVFRFYEGNVPKRAWSTDWASPAHDDLEAKRDKHVLQHDIHAK
jgi:hypothetical protein